MAVAADVPSKFDVVINGTGYLFYDQIDESLPFRTAKAIYSYSPTFVERQNTQGNFGDNQQDFWLTASQNDWSEGEQQRFFRSSDSDSTRKFWQGTNIEIRQNGQVSLRKAVTGLTFAAAIKSAVGGTFQHGAVSATNFYTVNNAGTIVDQGAHGLGAAPSQFGMVKSSDYFISTTAAGTVGVRRWNGAAFSTFSGTGADALAYLNNSLYGLTAGGSLLRYDTAGLATTLFTWRDPLGVAIPQGSWFRIQPYGGKLAILFNASNMAELWIYDGVGTSRLMELPKNFSAYDMVVSNGIIFISGTAPLRGPTVNTIFYYANGSTGLLWTADTSGGNSGPNLASWDDGIIWTDDSRGAFYSYEASTGSISTLGTYTPATTQQVLASSNTQFLYTKNSVSADFYPAQGGAYATSGTVTSSLFDLESSLDKLFRGIKVDWTAATDGDGGSIDIAYRVGDLTGSYTTLQTGAVSGTEYTLTGVTGRNISVKITLNKGTSTSGPILKRIYLRAAPVLQQYPLRQYTIAAFGDPVEQAQLLRDGTTNTKSGRALANDLITAVASTTPISVTDRFGTYTAILEPDNFELHEIHANPQVPATKSGSFVAKVTARGV